jgi:ribosome maturation factor RimP
MVAGRMPHPLTAQVLEIATPIAADFQLEIVDVTFHTNHSPPVLRVDVRNLVQDTALQDCETMSVALDAALEEANVIPDAYVLEVSSPGIPNVLTTDREFMSFRGFPVIVKFKDETTGAAQEKKGSLIRRDEDYVHLSQKGRAIKIKRSAVLQVELTA